MVVSARCRLGHIVAGVRFWTEEAGNAEIVTNSPAKRSQVGAAADQLQWRQAKFVNRSQKAVNARNPGVPPLLEFQRLVGTPLSAPCEPDSNSLLQRRFLD